MSDTDDNSFNPSISVCVALKDRALRL